MPDKKFDLSVIFRVIDKASQPIKEIGRRFKGLSQPIATAAKKLQALSITLMNVGRKMGEVGRSMAMRLTLPLTIFAGLMVRSAVKFQTSMNMVGAVTKATAEEFKALEKLARELGATTQFSASEAAEGMKFLGMAGLTVKQIFGALPKTLELAASAQMDLGTAADIVTNILSGFRLETKDLASVNDVLVNAFTSSNTDLQQLGEGMKVVGPVATAMKFRFTETAAALGILAKNAFQGTLGGTGLRRIMTNMLAPAKKAADMFEELGIKTKNANGTLKDLTGLLKEFENAQARGIDQMWLAEAAMEMFGQRGGPQFLALLGAGSEELKKFEKNLFEVGTSSKVALAQMERLPGAFKLLISAFEALQLSIMESGVGVFIEKAVRKIASFLQELSKTSPSLLALAAIFLTVVAAAAPLIIVLGWLVTAFATITAVAGLATILGTIAGAFVVLGGALVLLIVYWKEWSEIVLTATNNLVDLYKIMRSPFSGAFNFLKEKLGLGVKVDTSGYEDKFKWMSKYRNSETDINIKVTSDSGSTATVEKVKPKKGDANVNVSSVGYVGATQ